MPTSLRIARILGPVLCVIGLGMLLNGGVYRQIAMQFFSEYPFIYFSGLLALVAGLHILNAHNIWTRDWRTTISVFGLILTFIGMFRLLAPPFAAFVGGSLVLSAYFFPGAAVVLLAVGGFLSFKGYVAASHDRQQEMQQ